MLGSVAMGRGLGERAAGEVVFVAESAALAAEQARQALSIEVHPLGAHSALCGQSPDLFNLPAACQRGHGVPNPPRHRVAKPLGPNDNQGWRTENHSFHNAWFEIIDADREERVLHGQGECLVIGIGR